jgi:hypothetical protein
MSSPDAAMSAVTASTAATVTSAEVRASRTATDSSLVTARAGCAEEVYDASWMVGNRPAACG